MADAETNTFNFELVSPEEKLLSTPATMVVVPGEEGDFGVMPQHSALVSSIRPGVIEVHDNDDENEEPRRIFVAGGFADVTPDSLTVLAEEAVLVSDLNKDDLEQAIRNLEDDLNLVEGDIDKDRVQQKLIVTKAKLQAVTGELVL